MKMIWPETSVRINDARARERQWRRDVAAGLAGGVEAMVLRLFIMLVSCVGLRYFVFFVLSGTKKMNFFEKILL